MTMKLFPHGHATHPQWPMAVGLVSAQLRAQMALPDYAHRPALGLVYLTDHYAAHAQAILQQLRSDLPDVLDWAGTVGVGVCAPGVEYFDEPALSVMLLDLAPSDYRLFSGVMPLNQTLTQGFVANTALIHADGATPDLSELVSELAQHTESLHVFGGLSCGRGALPQWAVSSRVPATAAVFEGGLSGVAFGPEVALMSRVTQGCQPISKVRAITSHDQHLIHELDGEPALDVLLSDLGISMDNVQQAVQVLRKTLVGLSFAGEAMLPRAGQFGEEVIVRHIIGVDPQRRSVAVAHPLQEHMQMAFCRRDPQAAKSDLLRICAEVREALKPSEISAEQAQRFSDDSNSLPMGQGQIAGAIYISCSGRGGPHFGSTSAELLLVRRALGDVPLLGFFAGGEIAHQNIYGYTGVLTVFVRS